MSANRGRLLKAVPSEGLRRLAAPFPTSAPVSAFVGAMAAVPVATADHTTGIVATANALHTPAFSQQDLEEAFAQGHDVGLAAARAEREHAVVHFVAAIDRCRNDLVTEQRRAAEGVTADMVELGLEIARWVLGRALAVDPTVMLERLAPAIADLEGDESIEVSVSTELAAMVQEHLGAKATVVGDPAFSIEEFTLRAGQASVQSRFTDIAHIVRRALLASEREEADA